MATNRAFLESTLTLINVIGIGQSVPSEYVNQALDSFNEVLDALTAEGLIPYSTQTLTVPLIGNQVSYSIGPSGDLNTALRPATLGSHVWVKQSNTDTPVLLVTASEYGDIPDKDTTGFPSIAYYNPTYPTGTLTLWPKPNFSGTLKVVIDTPFVTTQALASTFAWPPAYQRFLRYELAVALSPEFGLPIDPIILSERNRLRQEVTINNLHPERLNMGYNSRFSASMTGGAF